MKIRRHSCEVVQAAALHATIPKWVDDPSLFAKAISNRPQSGKGAAKNRREAKLHAAIFRLNLRLKEKEEEP